MRLLSRKKLGANAASRPRTREKTTMVVISLPSTLRLTVGAWAPPPCPSSPASCTATVFGWLLRNPLIVQQQYETFHYFPTRQCPVFLNFPLCNEHSKRAAETTCGSHLSLRPRENARSTASRCCFIALRAAAASRLAMASRMRPCSIAVFAGRSGPTSNSSNFLNKGLER
jgi:hypothetical protein